MAFIGTRPAQHNCIARGLLVKPESTVCNVGDGVKPVERQDRQRAKVHPQITPRMVRHFMRNRQPLFDSVETVFEIDRHYNLLAEYPEGNG